MPRERKPENKGLPLRWRHTHGAYYYQVPPGQEAAWDGKKLFRLGATLADAYTAWAERLRYVQDAKTVAQLLDRYALEVIPKKAVTTQAQNHSAVKKIRIAFGSMGLADIKPMHVYRYVDMAKGKTGAKREVEVLSHALTKAVEWGFIDRHPFKGETRFEGEKSRTRYVEDWEVVECLSLAARRKAGSVLAAQAYIRIKLLTGLRRGDMLRLTMSDLKEDGMHVEPHKTRDSTGKRMIIEWSDELRSAVALAKGARPMKLSPFLFCNRDGEGYIDEKTGRAGGWESLWRNFITRVMDETKVKEHFTEHDLRAKCASDATTLEHARSLLAHADSKLTDRVYRRRPEVVKPLR
ncbi:tyrosine-type recombinase/integrase [Massilia phyllosphaerae]|uniref:tyrosine-type recombinase/integrase n=1 Tax=Massilia phyllosphaerae TaxID=3106034 RepID=UPI002B1CDA0C|nr:tyrosine-type recombinase/integrase [Massilia sp. SGZ-792]